MKLALAAILAILLSPPRDDDPASIGFPVLAGYEYKEGMQLPESVTKYDGKKVILSGFMKREDGGEGECAEFLLVNDACGCQGTPKLNEIVFCTMPEGQLAKIAPGVAKITGTLYVGEEKDDGTVISLYTLDVDKIGG
jgi:hypothetical protein